MANEKVGRCFWLPVAVPLTSTVNEVQTGMSPEAKENLRIVAALTNLSVSSAKVRDLSGAVNVANEYLPLLSMFGKRGSPRPAFYYPVPLPLKFGNRIEVELKNAAVGAEAAGHAVFIGLPEEAEQGTITDIEQRGNPSGFSLDAGLSGVANEITTKTSTELDRDFIIHGAFTDLQSAQVRITGVRGEQWMSDFTPVWGLAGRATDDIPTFYWPRRYLIPKGSTITVDFKNVGAEAAGLKLFFVGQKL
jgi:hypothetical protein